MTIFRIDSFVSPLRLTSNCIYYVLFFPSFIALWVFSMTCSAQELDSPSFRTNAQDVKLSVNDSSALVSTNQSESSPNQWKSLADPSTQKEPLGPALTPGNTNAMAPTDFLGGGSPKIPIKKDAYGPETGWGFRTAAGVAIQQSLSASFAYGNGHQNYNFQPGARFDMEVFYNLTRGFYFGIESGFIYNQISSVLVTAPDAEPVSLISGDPRLGYSAFYQVPVLLNLRFQIPNSGRFRGYCTGGFGGVWDYTTFSVAQSNVAQHQWNYAFQLGAGFQYNLLPGLDLDTSFKTFITPNPLLFSDGTSQVKTSYSYALEVGLAYRF